MKIIVISDIHLGTEECDASALSDFLDTLQEDREVTDLVLLGDVVEMWRRDASGVFLENMDMMQKLKSLKERMNLHYVAGNHDYHVLKMKGHGYPFEFKRELELKAGERTYVFKHGYEYEYADDLEFMRSVMESLCHVMSDSSESIEENLWGFLIKNWSEISYILKMFSTGTPREGKAPPRRIHDSPTSRLEGRLEEIEGLAHAEALSRPAQTLVFGHTHRPFISRSENLVNVGSWVTDAAPHNTYAVLTEERPRLFVFRGEEIKERTEFS